MEHSRRSEDNTATNATFAQSSLAKESNLLVTTSARPLASPRSSSSPRDPRQSGRQPGRLPGSQGWCSALGASPPQGHKAPRQPRSPGQGTEIPRRHCWTALPGKAKRAFPSLLAPAAAFQALPVKTAEESPGETTPWGSPAGPLAAQAPLPIHPGGMSSESPNSRGGTSRGVPRDAGKSPHPSTGELKKVISVSKKMEQLRALLLWRKRIQGNLIDAGGKTSCEDPCPRAHLCILSKAARTRLPGTRAARGGESKDTDTRASPGG